MSRQEHRSGQDTLPISASRASPSILCPIVTSEYLIDSYLKYRKQNVWDIVDNIVETGTTAYTPGSGEILVWNMGRMNYWKGPHITKNILDMMYYESVIARIPDGLPSIEQLTSLHSLRPGVPFSAAGGLTAQVAALNTRDLLTMALIKGSPLLQTRTIQFVLSRVAVVTLDRPQELTPNTRWVNVTLSSKGQVNDQSRAYVTSASQVSEERRLQIAAENAVEDNLTKLIKNEELC